MGLQTSKYMSRPRGEMASHMGKGTEVDEGKHREKPSAGPVHKTKGRFAELESIIGLKIGVHIIGRALLDLRWMILDRIIGNFPDWMKLFRVSSPMLSIMIIQPRSAVCLTITEGHLEEITSSGIA